jgi:hypothetical protein
MGRVLLQLVRPTPSKQGDPGENRSASRASRAITANPISGNARRAPRNHAIRFRGNTDGDRRHSSLRVAQQSSPLQGRAIPTRRYGSQIGLYSSLMDLCV